MKEQNNIQQAIPFFGVQSMQASLSFYVDGLGFTMTNSWTPRGTIEWCSLSLDSVAIMLQEYRQAPPADVKRGEGVSTCFICADALAFYHEIIQRQVATDEPFVGNNMWVVGVKDPDGYKLFFESPTDVPEETTYTGWKNSKPAE